ncbi:ATP synthase F0 sector subunit b [hydrothermal vent metagenome]|uniref:ATP synthase F0 sector subunit b n=1 Tax=hydrothermal vent metagenome TaxID=652676 RepID=A0A1W1CKF1_9ZZZZ
MISTYALASEVKDGGSDIVQRTVNFILFAGLVWYLVGEPIKKYFASRSLSIADELKKVQDKLDESMALKKDALAKVSDAEKFAQELAESSKKENKIIYDALMAQGETELETLEKQNLSKKEFEERKMVREVVEEIVTETLSQSADGFDKEAMANVILKKVA